MKTKLPKSFVWSVITICTLPFLFNLLGVDFGTQKQAFPYAIVEDMAGHERVEAMFSSLAGSFTHTLLEWTAFCTALFTVLLAFLHFKVKREITTPVIGVALFCAGLMDAFHTLAADRLIEAVADNRNLIPFTWAIARMFMALILIAGISLFLIKKKRALKGDLRFVMGISVVFGLTAFVIIEVCATSAHLPQTMYPEALITRPYDVIPLVLFVLGGFTVFRWFHHQQGGVFSHALLISMIPQTVLELHMVFGSTMLFDNHFNIAHFLKILAYFVPLGGLALDYVYTNMALDREIAERKQAEKRLAAQHGVARVLAEASSLDAAAPEILQAIGMGLGWQCGNLWEVDAQGNHLRCMETWQDEPAHLQEFELMTREITFTRDVGLPGRVWTSGEPHWILDVVEDRNFPRGPSAGKVGLHGAFAFPVKLGGTIHCVLEFFSHATQEPDEEILKMSVTLGRQIGQFALRKQMEITQLELHARMGTIINSTVDGIITIDSQGRIDVFNQAAEKIFGYEAEEVHGQNVNILMPSPYHEEHDGYLHRYLHTGEKKIIGKGREVMGRRKDGSVFPMDLAVSQIQLNNHLAFTGVVRDITERKQVEQALEQASQNLERQNIKLAEANEQALAAVQAKSEFLAMMSHEIRTPMNGVIGLTELLLDTAMTKDQREMAETIRHSGQSLLTIINDILDFSKVEAGKLDLEVIPFDLRTCVEEVLDLLAEKAQGKGLELIGLMYATVPSDVRGDHGRVRQVLMNVIGNAIKFTESGEVALRVTTTLETDLEVRVRFEVKDTGIGMAPGTMSQLFQSFSQGDGSTTRHYGGTGLGLAISKQIVELMGGEIGASSTPGEGTLFWCTIPFDKQPYEPASIQIPRGELQGQHICLVDNNSTNRLLLQHYTSSWGLRSESAEDGAQALGLMRAAVQRGDPFHLAVCDMRMPGMDGIQLARTIKSDPQLEEMGLVLLTSICHRGEARKAQDAGFAAYLTKPLHYAQLFETLCLVVGNGSSMARPSSLITRHTVSETTKPLRAKILLAEDNLVNQKVAVRLLEKLGHQVDIASSGQEAIEALDVIPYDLILMDCMMPEMDGYEATRRIRKRETETIEKLGVRKQTLEEEADSSHSSLRRPDRIPIIAMTANAMKGDREKCLEAGMDDFLTKPVSLEGLEAMLQVWVPKREASVGCETSPEIGVTNNEHPDTRNGKIFTSDEDTALDQGVLDDLRALVGDDDPSFYSSVVTQFLQDAPRHMQAIHDAMKKEDAEALTKAAHAFKGVSQNMGAKPLADVCRQMEEQGGIGTIEASELLFTQIKIEWEKVDAALQEELAAHKAVP